MSFQAMEAVQDHSKWVKGDENATGYKVMMAIARFANKKGIAGVAGDHKKCPSVRTLAEKAGLHHNSVQNWLPLLVESGELSIEKHGKGRGSHQVYTINLPINTNVTLSESIVTLPKSDVTLIENNVTSDINVTPQGVTIEDFNVLSESVTKLAGTVVTLQQLMSHHIELMSHSNVTNVTSQSVTDTVDTKLNTSPAEPEDAEEKLKPITDPFGIYQRLVKLEPGIKKGQTLRDAKSLLKGDKKRGITPVKGQDIIDCAKFMQTEAWRIENMVSLSTDAIIQKIPKWISANRPGNWDEWQQAASKQNGQHPPPKQAPDEFKQNLREALAKQQAAQG